MDGPIQLISTRVVGGRRQMYICPEALKILSDLPPRSVDVVSVVGPMRKGKSYLANRLCETKSGFPLGDELTSKTKDFWFWIGPHPVQSDRYLMAVDTEGLGDYSDEEQKDKDMKNLVLATLLSNHLVFNLQGNADSGFLSNLRLMGDLADCIHVKKDGSYQLNHLDEHFSELWVATQDVHLKPPQDRQEATVTTCLGLANPYFFSGGIGFVLCASLVTLNVTVKSSITYDPVGNPTQGKTGGFHDLALQGTKDLKVWEWDGWSWRAS